MANSSQTSATTQNAQDSSSTSSTRSASPAVQASASATDEFLWLEEIEAPKALSWARLHNERTLAALQSEPVYDELHEEASRILTSEERLPLGELRGEYVDNFWQDETHVRGVWRRTSVEAYRAGTPEWRTILDIDALAESEDENWVYQGTSCLPPDYDRCMVNLSRGGTDASVYREYSVQAESFVANGFVVPEGKNAIDWLDDQTLIVASDWGSGRTKSGYPRQVRRWKRDTPFADAKLIFEGDPENIWTFPVVYRYRGDVLPLVWRAFSFFEYEFFRLDSDGSLESLSLPKRGEPLGLFAGHLLYNPQESWRHGSETFPAGSVVALDLETGKPSLVFEPSDKQAINQVRVTRSSVLVSLMEDVVGKVKRIQRTESGWSARDVPLPDQGVIRFAGSSSARDDFFAVYESLTRPQSLLHVTANDVPTKIQSLPAFYDASTVRVEQHFAESADGTKVPYFVMGRADILDNGPAPTIQYGYGGFLIPILPVYYSEPARPQHGALAGKMWVQRGGVLVLSNIRGGGEYGPAWHQAALKENRQRAYDDFFAVAEDLIRRGVTTPDQLGAMGRSNGGLLMGVALTQRPDLYAAIDCGVPLFDMKRYSQLLAGASWVGEYGDPSDPQQWAYISRYSPYQKLQPGKPYPQVFFYTSTKDDRVHPGHARKAVAQLLKLGYPVYYYENIEGGHGGTANQDQLAMRTALEYTYFVQKLMKPSSKSSSAQ
ncbi:MAG: prolyl oligopeptidase family protein [Myxococcota bacterium]